MAFRIRSLARAALLLVALSLLFQHPAGAYYKTKRQKISEAMDSARGLLARGEVNRARDALRRVLRLDPDVPGAHRLLARMAVERDQWAIARHHLDWILQREPRDEEALYLSSQVDGREGRNHRAAAVLLILAREGAANPLVYRDLSDHLLAEGRRDEAIMILLRGIDVTGGSVWSVEKVADLWKEMGLYEQALAMWRIKPSWPDANVPSLFQQGFLYQKLGEPSLARAFYDSVLARDSRHPEARYNLALLSRSAGDHPAAARHFEELIAQNPSFERAYAELARAYLTLGEAERAQGVLTRLLETGQDPGLLWMATDALNRLGAAPDSVARSRQRSVESEEPCAGPPTD